MIKNKYLVSCMLLLGSYLSYGQQVPLYTQFTANQFMLNPGYTADEGHQDFYLGARRQWSSLRSTIETKYLTAQSGIADGKAAFGVSFINDQSEFTRKNTLMATYRYRIMFEEDNYLSLGLAAGAWDNNFDPNRIYTTDPSDPIYSLISSRGGMAFTSNAGILYRNGGLHLGVSVPHLFQTNTTYGDNYINVFDYQETRHVVINGRYDFKAGDNLTISPYVWIKDAGSLFDGQSDLGLMANFRDAAWISVAYRQHYSVSSHVGIRLGDRFAVGYAYDAPIGVYSKALGGSHEMMLGWRVGKNSGTATTPVKEAPKADTESSEVILKQNKEIDALKNKIEDLEQRQKIIETVQNEAPKKETPKTTPTPKPSTPDPVKPVETKPTVTTPAPTTPAVGSDESGEFILIAGSFSDQPNAMKFIKFLATKGKTGTYFFDTTKNTHYVYIGKYTLKSKAMEAKTALAADNIQVWVKKLK